jgi:glutamate synthase (NADPH/NADH) large chain
MGHNGEINTVKGNSSWMQAQSALFQSDLFSKEEMEMILPVCQLGQSDSAVLDNAVELLTLSGRSLPHVMMMLIPEAWDGNEHIEDYKRDFYEYHAALMEPWDGQLLSHSQMVKSLVRLLTVTVCVHLVSG